MMSLALVQDQSVYSTVSLSFSSSIHPSLSLTHFCSVCLLLFCSHLLCIPQGRAVVLQRKTEDGEYIEVGQLGPSDYFGKSISQQSVDFVRDIVSSVQGSMRCTISVCRGYHTDNKAIFSQFSFNLFYSLCICHGICCALLAI